MKRLLVVALILALVSVGATRVHYAAPVGDAETLPATPHDCHPVDSEDPAEDRYYGEQETMEDEGEIACVNDHAFAVIRRQLGLK